MKKLSILFGLAMFIAAMFVSASGPASAAPAVRGERNASATCPTCTLTGTFNLLVTKNSSTTRQPIAGANVSVYKIPSINPQPVATGTTDANGMYSTQLQAGNYRVKVTASGYNDNNQNFSIASSQTTNSTAYMSANVPSQTGMDPVPVPCSTCGAAGMFSLNVFKAGSAIQPIAGADISVYAVPGTSTQPVATGTTDSSGNYATGLPTGNYRVKIVASGYNTINQNFTVISSQTTHSTAYLTSASTK